MRLLASLAALVLLTGCNLVITHQPMFTQADSVGAPAPRPGLWRLSFGADRGCQVDETRPLKDWPSCSGGMVFGAGTVSYFNRDGEKATWTTEPLILAAGQPILGQVKVHMSGDIKLAGDAFAYIGVLPLKLDEAGRFTGFEFWPVQCGPTSKANDNFTTQPAAGVKIVPITADAGADFKVKEFERMCTIDEPAVMRRVAAQSEAWVERKGVGRWVRDKAD